MKTFDYRELPPELFCADIMALVAAIHEEKGRAEHFLSSGSSALKVLSEQARITSATASNRIEKIYASDERIAEIARGGVELKTQGESEIAGYLDLYDTIRDNYDHIPVAPSYILEMHRALFQYTDAPFAGQWKENDILVLEENEDSGEMTKADWEKLVQRQRRTYEPVSAYETPLAMGALCDTLAEAVELQVYDPLLLIALFNLDFACTRPFTNGNGRMNRLLALLMLDRAGFTVGNFISLEEGIAADADEYRRALRESSVRWRDNMNASKPFVSFFLSHVLAAYRGLAAHARKAEDAGSISKADRVRLLFEHNLGQLSKREIAQECPDISIATIEAALGGMVREGFLAKVGAGKGTRYVRNR